jgi:hypothetical protein
MNAPAICQGCLSRLRHGSCQSSADLQSAVSQNCILHGVCPL